MSTQNPSREGRSVIDDGYTRPAYLAGVAFTVPSVRFSYRPPLVKDLTIIRRELSKSPAASITSIQARAICKYVTEWSVAHQNGDAVQLKTELLDRVDPLIFEGVSQIVLGLRYTDIDPEWTREDSELESQRNLDSVFGGNVAAQESDDSKNS